MSCDFDNSSGMQHNLMILLMIFHKAIEAMNPCVLLHYMFDEISR